jgi:hypothetical protein
MERPEFQYNFSNIIQFAIYNQLSYPRLEKISQIIILKLAKEVINF